MSNEKENGNINGWNIIESLLDRDGRNQSWLAKALHVTPAAITQVKKSQYKLSAEQFNIICQALHATKEERCALYAAVISARFHVKANVVIQ